MTKEEKRFVVAPDVLLKNQQEKKSTLNQLKEIFNSLKEKDKPIYKHNKTNQYYEALRNREPHFIESNDKHKKVLEKVYSSIGNIYLKLSKADKKKVKSQLILIILMLS